MPLGIAGHKKAAMAYGGGCPPVVSLEVIKLQARRYSRFGGGVKDIIVRLRYGTTFNTIISMNTAAKLIDAMRNNPMNWRIDQLQTVAQRHGLIWRSEGGSHFAFIRQDGRALVIPARRPIRAVYVKKFVKFIQGE